MCKFFVGYLLIAFISGCGPVINLGNNASSATASSATASSATASSVTASSATASSATVLFVIATTAGTGGQISPLNPSVISNGSQTFTITSNAGYHINGVTLDGSNLGAISTWTINGVNSTHSLDATFALDTYLITTSPGPNGTMTPANPTVNWDSSQTINITPNAGYAIDTVTIDGTNYGAISSQTFSSVIATHTISATFSNLPETISVTQTANGTISPGTTNVNDGSSATFTITPSVGYHIVSVSVDGASVGSGSTYTFGSVTAPHTITATYAINTYLITTSPGPNGTITPANPTVDWDSSQTVNITPNAGYAINTVTIDGTNYGAISSQTFSSVNATHTISATFSNLLETISVTQTANGAISPGTENVNYGSSATFTITPSVGYHIVSVSVDGASVGSGSTYSFSSVTAPHTITATYAINTYTITTSAGVGGSISPSSPTVNYGSSQTITISSNAGYAIASVIVDGSQVATTSSYTFSSVTAAHSISATFSNLMYGISITLTAAGAPYNITFTPGGTFTSETGNVVTNLYVTWGANFSISWNNTTGSTVDSISTNGGSIPTTSTTYTFTNVQANQQFSYVAN